MTPVLSLPSFTGNRNNIDIFLYNWRALLTADTDGPSKWPGSRHRIATGMIKLTMWQNERITINKYSLFHSISSKDCQATLSSPVANRPTAGRHGLTNVGPTRPTCWLVRLGSRHWRSTSVVSTAVAHHAGNAGSVPDDRQKPVTQFSCSQWL